MSPSRDAALPASQSQESPLELGKEDDHDYFMMKQQAYDVLVLLYSCLEPWFQIFLKFKRHNPDKKDIEIVFGYKLACNSTKQQV